MIEIRNERPSNAAHVDRLLAFARELVGICDGLGIEPVLSGSLAVFGYTRDPALIVNDIDLACHEREFARLSAACEARGIGCALRPWHTLQALRDGLKVEFDSLEHWMSGLPEDDETLAIGGLALRVVSLASLCELYRRGLEQTARSDDAVVRAKHAAIEQKYRALLALRGAPA